MLGFLMGTLTGGILAVPLLRWGARLDRSRASAMLARAAAVSVILAAFCAVPIVLKSYPRSYANVLIGLPALVTLLLIPFVAREKPRDWSQLPHACAGLFATMILGSELFLALAAAGQFPAHYPAALVYVADRRAMTALTGSLRDADPLVRREAVKLLATCGKDAVPALHTVVADPDPSVRTSALSALRNYPHPDTTPLMLSALQERSPAERGVAYLYFNNSYDPRIVPPLLAALAAGTDSSDLFSIQNLVGRSAPEIIPALSEQLRSEDAAVRRAVAQALERAPIAETVPLLEVAMRDRHPAVRAAAAETLGEIARSFGDDRGQLISAIHNGGTVRKMFENSNKRPPDMNRIVRALIPALTDPYLPVRLAAVKALEHAARREFQTGTGGRFIPDRESGMPQPNTEAAVLPLLACLKSEGLGLRQPALDTLALCVSPQSVPALTAALPSADRQTRLGLIKALGATGDPRAIPAVRKYGEELHMDNRCEVCQVFYELEAYDEIQHRVVEDQE